MVLPCWFRRRSRGWARNYGAAGETRKSKFAKRTWNVPWNQQINFLVRSIDRSEERRVGKERRDVCATRGWIWMRRANPTVGNEAGMCPGINRFTKCAPIADWVRRGVPLWCSRGGCGDAAVVAPVRALRVRHENRNSQNEPGMCLGINKLTFWCGP